MYKKIRLPGVNIAKAIKYYYSTYEMTRSQIIDMYDNNIKDCGWRQLSLVIRQTATGRENPISTYYERTFDTKIVFVACGLDIDDLEARYGKLVSFNLV